MSQNTEHPVTTPMVIEDMSMMAQFVYDFYNSKVDMLMKERGFDKVINHFPFETSFERKLAILNTFAKYCLKQNEK